ncbi:MAG: pilus assembly protein TadG-related protein [Solirubrobacteraceae bacterium]
MSGRRSRGRGVRDERGVVLVMVALMLLAIIGVGGLVVDVGNWFAHKRHLQVQADAGALAGAGKFRIPCDPSVSATIVNESAKYSSVEYSGPGGTPGPGYNPQLATPAGALHRMTNSKRFFGPQGPTDTTAVEKQPCPAKMIDVKLTETDLPWFLKIAQVPFINAHARVEIRKKSTSGANALPVGVPEVGPQTARALFVDESNGDVIASTDLVRTGTSNGLAIWSNSSTPKPVTIDRANIGVRIVLSGNTATTTCGDLLVNCYGAGTNAAITANTPGLVHIRGWSDTPTGTATAPRARNVDLLSGTCEDGYFTATAGSCTVGIRATIEGLPSTATVFAKRTTGANTKVPLTFSAGVWTATSGIPITAGEGPVRIDLRHGSGQGDLIETVQRSFAGNESVTVSGPIKLLRLSEAAVPGANSFKRCDTCAHDLVVTLGLKPDLQTAQSINDPIVSLKVAGGGSRPQGLDCDPDKPNIRDELAEGCGPTYEINEGQPCPRSEVPGGAVTALWSTPQPWKCVAINNGATVGQVTQGMNKRILGDTNPSTCTAPNNWSSFPNLPEGDPRIVDVFLAPFGAFSSGSGSGTIPVTGFSAFYVTGWDGGGCQGGRAPAGRPDDPAGQGEIVGHYIKYIYTLNNGGGGEEICDYDSLGSCVAVFTR